MVVKTDVCFFTEYKIYPGHGIRVVRKDGKLLAFINKKSRSLYHQKIKAQRLTWTQQWRRRHKKGKVETVNKKKTKRATKVYKAIQGIDIEAIKKKRDLKPEARKAAREADLRQVKERKRKTKEEGKKKTSSKAPPKAKEFVKVPKLRQKMRTAGARR